VKGGRSVARGAGVAGACVLLVGLGWAVFGGGGRAAAPLYVSEAADRGPITVAVTATGVVEPVRTVQVGTYVSGPILALYADFNSAVAKDQLVAKIDPASFAVKVRQAEANLGNARAKADKARADLVLKQLGLGRARELNRRDLLAQDELDTAESNEAQARAQLALEESGIAQAAAALEEARIQLGYTDIRSPVDGIVISRNVDVGQTVAASFQTPTLFSIAEDLAKMRVRASVSESDIGGLAEGQPATFGVDAWPGRSFAGAVVQVRSAPVAIQNVVTYDVLIEVDNASLELKPGMTATVAITTAHRDDALRVPLRALRFRPEEEAEGEAKDGDAPTAFVVGAGGALRRVTLRTGIRDERFAEVLGGELAPGDPLAVAYPRGEEPAAPGGSSPFQPRRPR
jgi:HlyD family secretion protein